MGRASQQPHLSRLGTPNSLSLVRICLLALFSLCIIASAPSASAQGTSKDLTVVAQRSSEYILGCELDGTLFAVDAESGDVRWRLENPTKTFFRSSASVADLAAAMRNNESLKAPLFIPSLDGGLFFFTETGSFQQLPKTARDIIMNPPFITEDGSVLIGRKDTQIYVIELATGRVIDSVVASDEDPISTMPFTGHWPPGCVLIAASTYTVKGLHPLAPENKWSVVLTEFMPVLTTMVDDGPSTEPASRSTFLVSPTGDLHCVDESSRVMWTLPWSAQLAALYRVTFSTSGAGRLSREELTLLSDKLVPSALTLDHAPVYVGQLNGQLFAAPYKKAVSGAQLRRPGVLQLAPPAEADEPEVCLLNGTIVGLHLLPAPAPPALLPADPANPAPPSPLTLPAAAPADPALDPPKESENVPIWIPALATLGAIGAALLLLDRRRKRLAARAASLAAPPVPHVAPVATEEVSTADAADATLGAKRKQKKKGAQQQAPAPSSPAVSSAAADAAPSATATAPPALPVEPPLPPGVKRVGKIELQLERILGYGSNGTVVYEGHFDGRRVAVKRLLRTMYDVASKEVTLFLESDEHPHVVRYYAKEEDGDFIYLALTLCVATLEDLVSPPADRAPAAPLAAPPIDAIVLQLALGLQHLHTLHIIHRDLKPANVLLDHRSVIRIADMGLARKMGPDEFSVSGGSLRSAMAGSLGWRPPEICKVHHAALADPSASPAGRLHLSKKIDIFALGCIFYYVLTKGKHPFGQPFEREANILANKFRLDDPRCTFEAADLIRSMIQPEPKLRPNIEQVLRHPFFWDANKKLLFFRDASDRVEVEKPNAPVVLALEARAPAVIGPAWGPLVDAEMLDSGGKYRKYNFASIRDLLRVIRNKSHHYRDLPASVQARVGSLPDGFLAYFTSRFPSLLLEVHRVLQHHYPGEPALRQYM